MKRKEGGMEKQRDRMAGKVLNGGQGYLGMLHQ